MRGPKFAQHLRRRRPNRGPAVADGTLEGAPFRVVVAAEKPLEGELRLTAPDGSVAVKSRERHDGPPYFWFAEVASPAGGLGVRPSCATMRLPMRRDHPRDRRALPKPSGPGSMPRQRLAFARQWNRATENLFSAWIDKLFDDPLDAEPCGRALHVFLRDESRNVLFNHFGLERRVRTVSFAPTVPISPYFCAPISRSRWDCRSGFRIVARQRGMPPYCSEWFTSAFKITRPAPPPIRLACLVRRHRHPVPPILAPSPIAPVQPHPPPSAEPKHRVRVGVRRIFEQRSPTSSIPVSPRTAASGDKTDFIRFRGPRRRYARGPSSPIPTGTS